MLLKFGKRKYLALYYLSDHSNTGWCHTICQWQIHSGHVHFRSQTEEYQQDPAEAPAGRLQSTTVAFTFLSNKPCHLAALTTAALGIAMVKPDFSSFQPDRRKSIQNRIFPHTKLFLPPYGRSKLVKLMLEGIAKWFWLVISVSVFWLLQISFTLYLHRNIKKFIIELSY